MAASSSKLLTLTLSSSVLRRCRLAYTSHPTASRCLPGSLLPLRFCSAGPAAVDVAAEPTIAALSAGHPWPEWGEFLEKLRAKGYFERSVPASATSAGEGAAGDGEEAVAAAADNAVASEDTYPFRDQNRVKNACLKFARERFDLLSSLPKQDIQDILKSGCPNIYRKVVNSAKRLRKFVQIEERDACSVCKLRASCDKAYLEPTGEEEVRTVDVVRILLNYAIDTNSLSGENSVNGSVQVSARKLLSELTKLSDTTIDPSLPKPEFQTSSKKDSSTKLYTKSKESGSKARSSVGMGRETTATEMKKGDWLCTNCNFLNFARNRSCLECKADGPKKVEAATTEMKMGDWICIQCHFMNFARNKICFKCEEPRPKRQLNPGEWECPSCNYLNFRGNQVCKKCNQGRPEDDTQDNQMLLRHTRGAGRSRSFDDQEDDGDDASPYKGFRKHTGSMSPRLDRRRNTDKSRRFADQGDGLFTAVRRSAEEDDDDVLPYEGRREHVMSRRGSAEEDDDDVLPYEGRREHVMSRRATPAQRRFTAARRVSEDHLEQ